MTWRLAVLYTKQASGTAKDILPQLETAAKDHRFGVLRKRVVQKH
jgi:hypothetical protein